MAKKDKCLKAKKHANPTMIALNKEAAKLRHEAEMRYKQAKKENWLRRHEELHAMAKAKYEQERWQEMMDGVIGEAWDAAHAENKRRDVEERSRQLREAYAQREQDKMARNQEHKKIQRYVYPALVRLKNGGEVPADWPVMVYVL